MFLAKAMRAVFAGISTLVSGGALAQIPDKAITDTTSKFLDYGIAGAVIVVLVAACFFLTKTTFACLNASIERTAAVVKVVEEQKDTGEKVIAAMDGQSRRLEAMEKTQDRLCEKLTQHMAKVS